MAHNRDVNIILSYHSGRILNLLHRWQSCYTGGNHVQFVLVKSTEMHCAVFEIKAFLWSQCYFQRL